MDVQSGESEEEEVTGEGIGESNMEELVQLMRLSVSPSSLASVKSRKFLYLSDAGYTGCPGNRPLNECCVNIVVIVYYVLCSLWEGESSPNKQYTHILQRL